MTNYDNLRARIQTLIDKYANNNNDFAKQCGLEPSNFAKMMKGQQKITDKTIKKISSAFQVEEDWIKTGEKKEQVETKVIDISPSTRPHIPTNVAAGMLACYNDPVHEYDCERRPTIKVFPPYDFTMTVQGSSMEPKFEGGDQIACKQVEDHIEWGKTYVLDTRDGPVLKRIYDEGECYRCVSYNNEYPDFLVNKEDILHIFRVVAMFRIG